MKKIVGIFAFVLCITYLSISSNAQSNEFPCTGIVTASKLICRTEPVAGSTAITSFNFSNPIVLINKSKTKVRINNIEEYWYQEQTTKGWVFGGYLLMTKYDPENIFLFNPNRIFCNVICGGASCFYDFHPYLIGDYYIAYTYLNDYAEEGKVPNAGIMIGKYEILNDSIVFNKVIKFGGYYSNGEWISNIENELYDLKESISKFHSTFYKVNDADGIFYIDDLLKKVESRSILRKKCEDKTANEEIWYTPYSLDKSTFEDCKKDILKGVVKIK